MKKIFILTIMALMAVSAFAAAKQHTLTSPDGKITVNVNTDKAIKVIFRAYDDGVAYRFVSLSKKPFEVKSEKADFTFPVKWNAYIPYVCQNDGGAFDDHLHNSFENTYKYESMGYGKERNVGIILWAGYGPFQKDIEKACKGLQETHYHSYRQDNHIK